ncbi:MAG: TetR family transcriptional regulator [Phenylobacterium sp.]|nr:TetR family transcriptional regulator [Phenylobacterium sp.]
MRTALEGERLGEDSGQLDVRERILETASELFYRRGVRAVGVDVVVEAAGVAKTSLYRHFRTKDDLIAAFLQREDKDFWACWERVAERYEHDAKAELEAHLTWIAERVGRPNYRGCPQLNVAAEFPDEDHPARVVARSHKEELRRRLQGIAERLQVGRPSDLALQLSVVINGAFVSSQVLAAGNAKLILFQMARALVAAAESGPAEPS